MPSVHPPISRPLIDTTFLVAVSLLGVIACALVAALLRAPAAPSPVVLAATADTGPMVSDELLMSEATHSLPRTSGAPTVSTDPTDPTAPETPAVSPEQEVAVVEAALAEVAMANRERQLVASLPRPTPVPVRKEVTPETRVIGLVNLARALRERGDTSTALTRLREAQVIFPSHPLIISEMAITYEKMELTDKAVEQWRRIYEFGERAGIYYAAAEAKMRALRIPVERPAFEAAPNLDGTPWEQPGAAFAETAAGAAESPALMLGKVGTTNDTGNSHPLRRLTLRVPILARPGRHVEVEEVTIQVYFYDRLKDGNIVETNADVSYAWVPRANAEGELPVDWSSPEPEVLDASYAQPEPDANDPSTMEPRNYFGYVVRVYYKGELNATYADPIRLLNQFPPPQTLQPSDLPQ